MPSLTQQRKNQHDTFLTKLCDEINKFPDVKAEKNCKYFPILRERYDYKKPYHRPRLGKSFEYDIIVFPRKGTYIDEYHPTAFIEFTNQKIFSSKKFLYEVYRWQWFCWGMGIIKGVPPFPRTPLDIIPDEMRWIWEEREIYKEHLGDGYNPHTDSDINCKSFSPIFIQIWMAHTLKRNYQRYLQSGLVSIQMDVKNTDEKVTIYGMKIDLKPIYQRVYHRPISETSCNCSSIVSPSSCHV